MKKLFDIFIWIYAMGGLIYILYLTFTAILFIISIYFWIWVVILMILIGIRGILDTKKRKEIDT